MTNALNSGANDSAQRLADADSSGVLIILPVLNEVDNITELLDGIHRELADIPYTVCIIDDGSKDGTVEKIQAAMAVDGHHLYLIQRQKRLRGSQRGSALKAGLEWGLQHTEHGIFVEIDGDLSHRPEELKTGIRLVEEEGYNVAIASKYVPGSQVINRPLGRRLVSLICSMAVGTVITRQIKDWSNGYRFYDWATAQLLTQHKVKYGGPIYLTEVLSIWLKRGMRVVEFPTLYVGRNEGLSKLKIHDYFKAGLCVFEIGYRYHVRGFARKAEHPDVYPGLADAAGPSASALPSSKKSAKRSISLR
jgi:dolichol-phosphate mannosyltransferase